MLAFFGRSILLGIVTAIALLVIFPDLRTQMFDSPKDLVAPVEYSQTQLSFNYAVRRASPAVVNIYNRRYNADDRLQLSTQGLLWRDHE
ncbi:outer membrane stress sensor protease DegS [Photobacterium aphoticum]|uniref:Outer membrane stress sensor protease DegS n=1 Tax=Photobacterium aphoticum TaxID=754436 RepID=A0A090RFV5_9GAMM|nr:outer membrane stress sensor protease DegS [Photobacterium aphoticum]